MLTPLPPPPPPPQVTVRSRHSPPGWVSTALSFHASCNGVLVTLDRPLITHKPLGALLAIAPPADLSDPALTAAYPVEYRGVYVASAALNATVGAALAAVRGCNDTTLAVAARQAGHAISQSIWGQYGLTEALR